MFILALAIQILGFILGGDGGSRLSLLGIFIVFGYATKWFVWEPLCESWQRYQRQRLELFDTIKRSDSQNQ